MTTLGVVLLVLCVASLLVFWLICEPLSTPFWAIAASIVSTFAFGVSGALVLDYANRCVEKGHVTITGQRCADGVCSTATWTETRCVRRASDKTAEAP